MKAILLLILFFLFCQQIQSDCADYETKTTNIVLPTSDDLFQSSTFLYDSDDEEITYLVVVTYEQGHLKMVIYDEELNVTSSKENILEKQLTWFEVVARNGEDTIVIFNWNSEEGDNDIQFFVVDLEGNTIRANTNFSTEGSLYYQEPKSISNLAGDIYLLWGDSPGDLEYLKLYVKTLGGANFEPKDEELLLDCTSGSVFDYDIGKNKDGVLISYSTNVDQSCSQLTTEDINGFLLLLEENSGFAEYPFKDKTTYNLTSNTIFQQIHLIKQCNSLFPIFFTAVDESSKTFSRHGIFQIQDGEIRYNSLEERDNIQNQIYLAGVDSDGGCNTENIRFLKFFEDSTNSLKWGLYDLNDNQIGDQLIYQYQTNENPFIFQLKTQINSHNFYTLTKEESGTTISISNNRFHNPRPTTILEDQDSTEDESGFLLVDEWDVDPNNIITYSSKYMKNEVGQEYWDDLPPWLTFDNQALNYTWTCQPFSEKCEEIFNVKLTVDDEDCGRFGEREFSLICNSGLPRLISPLQDLTTDHMEKLFVNLTGTYQPYGSYKNYTTYKVIQVEEENIMIEFNSTSQILEFKRPICGTSGNFSYLAWHGENCDQNAAITYFHYAVNEAFPSIIKEFDNKTIKSHNITDLILSDYFTGLRDDEDNENSTRQLEYNITQSNGSPLPWQIVYFEKGQKLSLWSNETKTFFIKVIAYDEQCGTSATQWAKIEFKYQGCPFGQYTDPSIDQPTSDHDCLMCPIGTYSGIINATSVDECLPCEEGTYVDHEGAQFCYLCDKGSYQGGQGYNYCNKCGPGTYQNEKGMSYCNLCPAGTFSDISGNTNVMGCTECPLGKFSNISGATSTNDCTECPDGFYNDVEAATACQECDLGYESKTSKRGCQICEEGYYRGEMDSSCQECEEDTISIIRGSTSCTACGQQGICTGKNECQDGRNSTTYCATCMDGYFSLNYQCASCPFKYSIYIAIVLIIITLAILIHFFSSHLKWVYFYGTNPTILMTIFALQLLGILSQTIKTEEQTLGLFKALQIISEIVNFQLTNLISSQCYADFSFFQQYLINCLTPITFFAGCLIFYFYLKSKNDPEPSKMPLFIFSRLLRIFFIPYTFTTMQPFLFVRDTQNDTYILSANNSITRDSEEYTSKMALYIIMAIFFVAFSQIYFAVITVLAKKSDFSQYYNLRFNWLFHPFKKNRYWFESVQMLIRSIVIIISIFLANSGTIQIIIICLSLFIWIVLIAILKPYCSNTGFSSEDFYQMSLNLTTISFIIYLLSDVAFLAIYSFGFIIIIFSLNNNVKKFKSGFWNDSLIFDSLLDKFDLKKNEANNPSENAKNDLSTTSSDSSKSNSDSDSDNEKGDGSESDSQKENEKKRERNEDIEMESESENVNDSDGESDSDSNSNSGSDNSDSTETSSEK
ncbi:insulin-like growth factor binding protein [Anaeramoeba flamelloides]|uniref:Insulin-like growth factor binding protein n=1 Tax=Anaeramoeba flamelloides TaxID=1746091 RepID=A0ABQ8XC31_9EUKA|nr:insulin-like growth factor binding protein [Anaeramoeba flamelloides]